MQDILSVCLDLVMVAGAAYLAIGFVLGLGARPVAPAQSAEVDAVMAALEVAAEVLIKSAEVEDPIAVDAVAVDVAAEVFRTVAELRKAARAAGIRGTAKMRRAELVAALAG